MCQKKYRFSTETHLSLLLLVLEQYICAWGGKKDLYWCFSPKVFFVNLSLISVNWLEFRNRQRIYIFINRKGLFWCWYHRYQDVDNPSLLCLWFLNIVNCIRTPALSVLMWYMDWGQEIYPWTTFQHISARSTTVLHLLCRLILILWSSSCGTNCKGIICLKAQDSLKPHAESALSQFHKGETHLINLPLTYLNSSAPMEKLTQF